VSSLRQQGLRIDDPLAPSPAPPRTRKRPRTDARPSEDQQGTALRAPTEVAGAAQGADPPRPTATATQPQQRTDRDPGRGGARAGSGVWRAWHGPTRVASYRLPDELLGELTHFADAHGLPVGLLVCAAITHLLDQDLQTITALVDRAEDARFQGRRLRARRGGPPRAATPHLPDDHDHEQDPEECLR
jgi:hypothetical protein